MLRAGDHAPDLSLPDQHGRMVRLSELRGRGNAVVFFYPKADTAVCTVEACSFRDHYEEFMSADTVVIGISADDGDAQLRFAQRWQLPFPLLSDRAGVARKAFGVGRWMGAFRNRITFVIDREGMVRHVVAARFNAHRHVHEALASLRDQRSL